MELWTLVGLSLGLGLLAFIEPCTVGAHLFLVKYLEGKAWREQITQMTIFAITRALFTGVLGGVVTLIGNTVFDLQSGFWTVLGIVYVLLGFVYLLGKQASLLYVLGPHLQPEHLNRRTIMLGILFGLNIPACAIPLLTAVLGAGLAAVTIAQGFLVLALFGATLSFPLMLILWWRPARTWLERIAALSQAMPFWTGLLFILLGLWSIWLGVKN